MSEGVRREALQALRDIGLVRRKRRSTVIVQHSRVDATILFAVGHRLEPMAAATARGKLTLAYIRTLERHLGNMRQAIPRRPSLWAAPVRICLGQMVACGCYVG